MHAHRKKPRFQANDVNHPARSQDNSIGSCANGGGVDENQFAHLARLNFESREHFLFEGRAIRLHGVGIMSASGKVLPKRYLMSKVCREGIV